MFETIGQIVCLGFVAALAALGGATLVARFFARSWNPLLRPALWLIDLFHMQMKAAYAAATGSSSKFDRMMVAARNAVNRSRFLQTRRRLFLAPHCIRGLECPARSTQYGIQCVSCGKCKLGTIREACREAGCEVFILAGSSFVKSLVQEKKPDGILLLGCPYEINKVMRHLRGRPTYGLMLTRDGCVETDVDLDEVIESIQSRERTGRDRTAAGS